MRTHILVKLHEIMAFQAFLLYRLSAMGAEGQIMDILLRTVRTCEKFSAGTQE
jgi:hypothetical protein